MPIKVFAAPRRKRYREIRLPVRSVKLNALKMLKITRVRWARAR
jgi:hypothetical protein